jgi:hypothetical protein
MHNYRNKLKLASMQPYRVNINHILIILLILLSCPSPANAQVEPRVQVIDGTIDPGGQAVYLLSGLKQGQHIYIYVETTSGNLDPIAALLAPTTDFAAMIEAFRVEVAAAARQEIDPSQAINEVRDQYALVWDDDSGEGYAAAFEYLISQDGDYQLLVSGSFSALGRGTYGSYRLLASLDDPQVLTGVAEPTGEPFASLDIDVVQPVVRIQEVSGSITPETPVYSFNLNEFNPGDVFYAYIEATSGELTPILILRDYGGKPLTVGNLSGEGKTASLQYAFLERSENIVLDVYGGDPAEPPKQGEYRLLVGVNQPDVLTGSAETTELSVLREPIEVKIGLKLQQIIDVNFQDEFFSIVASMAMEWTDPALAFSPDTCQCKRKIYTEKEFDRFLADVNGRWPDYTLYNQQGNRWVQNRVVVADSNGHTTYFERFSTNLQVDFDFRKFPFDTQQFPIRIDMLYPVDRYYFTDLEGFSEISQEHGEDEFIITDFETSITEVQSSTNSTVSRFTFQYEAPRHLNYYILQIFVPIFLIVMISWWTFFLKDYGKRIEVAAGNVLLFIAFSFSLTENYPRLGYMTFMDAIMAMIFIVNALVLIYNIYMRKSEMAGQIDRVEKIDNVMDWLYPVLYLVAIGVVYYLFFIRIPPA